MLIQVLSTIKKEEDFRAEVRHELTIRWLERERGGTELEGEVVRGFKFYRETKIFLL